MVVGLAGGGHGVHGASVEGVERGDDLVGPVLVQLAVAAGQLQRALHGLGAAVAEEHPVHARVLNEHLGDVQLRQGVELVGCLDERRRLLGDGVHHHRRAVPQVVHGPAGHEVDVLLAVGVPHSRALAPHDDHRPSAHGLGIVLLLDGDVFSVAGHDKSAPCECVGTRRHTRRGVSHYTAMRASGCVLPPVSLRPRTRCGGDNLVAPKVAEVGSGQTPGVIATPHSMRGVAIPLSPRSPARPYARSNSCLLMPRSRRIPWHGSRGEILIAVSGNCGFEVVGRVDPDFVRSASLTMKGASQSSQFPGQFPVGHTAMEMRPLPVWDRTIPSGNGLPRSL